MSNSCHRGTRAAFPLAVCLALSIFLFLSATASAAQTRNYTGTYFGPDGVGGSESFAGLSGIAVDQSKGFVYAYAGYEGGKIFKFDTSGNPVPFSGLPGNVIEGVGGTGSSEQQIAVAPPGSPGNTGGDIYVATNSIVRVFSETGAELGSLGTGETCGVAVSPTNGHLYIGVFGSTIREYVPRQNPPTEADLVATGKASIGLCNVAADSAGGIYAASYGGANIVKLDGIADTEPTKIQPTGPTLFADPADDSLFVDRREEIVTLDSNGVKTGAFAAGEITNSLGVAVSDQAEKAYVADAGERIKVYGGPLPLPDSVTGAASPLFPDRATLNGTVTPDGVALQECNFEYGVAGFEFEAPCSDPNATEVSPAGTNVAVHATATGLERNTAYQFRLVTKTANGTSRGETKTLTTPDYVVTEPASVSAAEVTLTGKVYPSGGAVSECKFEYKLADSTAFEGTRECDPPAGGIPHDANYHPVTAHLNGLQPGSSYRFRLIATTVKGTVAGQTKEFETFGKPGVRELRASDADQQSVTLEAIVNPRGSSPAFRFEWGPGSGYGRVAAAETVQPYGQSGLVIVKSRVVGLDAASIYHYRLVATNDFGPTESRDATFETLNSCGLPDGRCFEQVSERQSGPIANLAYRGAAIELHFQAAADGSDLAYVAEQGFPDATKGTEVLYRARRGLDGWLSNQLSAPIISRNVTGETTAHPSAYAALSRDLSCGVLASNQPLTDDASTRYAIETGGANLYRDNMDGTYTALTTIAPDNPGDVTSTNSYQVVGMSRDCQKVIFRVAYRYPGVPTAPNISPLYEWDHGTLRSLGLVPGPSGEEFSELRLGNGNQSKGDKLNAVSEDASRVFFSSERRISPNPAEVGPNVAVFVREGGQTRDLTLSETGTPDLNAEFEWATPDGSKMFFLANAGLTTDSSSAGEDLYEYDLEANELVDLTADEDAGGAEVAGMIGASDDGSRIYFVARGELDPGHGSSFSGNVENNEYSIFTEKEGVITYVAPVLASRPRVYDNGSEFPENLVQSLLSDTNQTARVSADGRYLLFESAANVTGYVGGNNTTQAYLYDVDSSEASTTCISCPQDGRPSRMGYEETLLQARSGSGLGTSRTLVVRNGQPVVFFTSNDSLASGGTDGLFSVYEWAHGQVFRVVAEPPGLQSKGGGEGKVELLDAGASGADVYFVAPQRLSWEDEDDRASVYDARVGGGFPEPPPSPAPCDANVESSCQTAPPTLGPSVQTPATSSFQGPGNPRRHKHHKKRHHKKKHHHRANRQHRKEQQANAGKDKKHHKQAGSNRRQGA